MADVWARVADLDEETQQSLAQVLETRGADAQQRSMRAVFLGDIPFPSDARVLELADTGLNLR